MSLIYCYNWEYLPELLILKIYNYLDDNGKVKMSLICKRWGSLFNSACLWRVRHFDLSGYNDLNQKRRNGNTFVTKHGAHVRYLTISCGPFHTNETFQKSIEDLLSSQLRHSHLYKFEIKMLQIEQFWQPAQSRNKFINYFFRFFKQQHYLKTFDMTSAQFPLTAGIRILDTVGTKCGSIMEELFIENFFPSRSELFQSEKFKRVLNHFSNLNYLAISYNCLSDSVLEILATNLVGLKTMKIKVSKDDPHGHRISSQAWNQMVTCCPALSVSFWFDSIGDSSEIVPILKREIPVTSIHIMAGFEDDADDGGLTRTINHIAELYKNSLESVHLEFNNIHEHVDGAVLGLVIGCRKLRDVSLNGIISVDTIRSLLQLEEEDKIRLHSLNILVWGAPISERAEILLLKQKYANLVTERCLKLEISIVFIPFQFFSWG